jgi:serine/threonine protein kinase
MNLLSVFQRSRAANRPAGPHMTWAKSSVGRSISRTGLFLKRQIWIWPIIAVVVLSTLGLFVRWKIESVMRESLRSELQTTLNLEAEMLRTWFNVQESNVESLANDLDIRQLAYQLLEPPAATGSPSPANDEALQMKLEKALGPAMSAHDYEGYLVANKKQQIVAAQRRDLIGLEKVSEYDSFLSRALNGEVCLSPPFASAALMKDDQGRSRTGLPTMFVAAPIRDESFQVVGAIALRIPPEDEFARIVGLGQFGQTGETYAFDKNGLIVSDSRFNDELVLMGILADPGMEDARSVLKLLIRDPGGDITAGHHSGVRRHELPLTKSAAAAIEGLTGVDVEGYRDYRGVKVVGAWTWLPQAQIGLVTEIDYAEAYRPLTILQRTFWGLYALLVLAALAIFVFTLMVARLRRDAQKAAIEAQQIGQYKLEQKLGQGGMGVVYKGYHAMLRRPTAIKMLDVDKVNDASTERFEREVQITSQLNHPNTVAIYDYGRTPEGVFYYAMEYLDGIDLQTLVERYGPQPVPRTIHILTQICGSLYEAHSQGMVHRDIKPANIMLTRRGGEPDVVKVLDFGLVKAVDDEKRAGMTQQNALTGTPLYMSPEAIEMPSLVDPRSDIYAVGAVGYFLLTGQPVFEAENVLALCDMHVSRPPVPPSERARITLPAELEAAILACLEKQKAKRPQTARELAVRILKCAEAAAWNVDEADAWWGRHERGQSQSAMPFGHSSPNSSSGSTRPNSDHMQTIDNR